MKKADSYKNKQKTAPAKVKWCPKCEEWKSGSEFYKNRNRTCGLSDYCRKCVLKRVRKYYRRGKKKVKKYYRYEEVHRVVRRVRQKRCLKCRKWKPETQFQREKRNKDGLNRWCRECENRRSRRYQRRQLALRK